VFLVSLGVTLALASVGFIVFFEVVPTVIAVMGAWLIVLYAVQKTQKRDFGTFSWGLLLLVGGSMGFLYLRDILTGLFLPVIVIVLGVIGILAVLRSRKKNQIKNKGSNTNLMI